MTVSQLYLPVRQDKTILVRWGIAADMRECERNKTQKGKDWLADRHVSGILIAMLSVATTVLNKQQYSLQDWR